MRSHLRIIVRRVVRISCSLRPEPAVFNEPFIQGFVHFDWIAVKYKFLGKEGRRESRWILKPGWLGVMVAQPNRMQGICRNVPVYSAVANEIAVGKWIYGLSTNKESQYIHQLLDATGSTNPNVFTIDSKLKIDISTNSIQTGLRSVLDFWNVIEKCYPPLSNYNQ